VPFKFTETPIPGLLVVEPRVFPDGRGFFLETYKDSEFRAAGIPGPFLQDNQSGSVRGVLRGLHYQDPPHAQGKLVRVIRGAVWDVAADLRKDSPTYSKWFGLELSEENRLMLYVPPGFAHGYLTLSDTAEFQYKCTAEYNKAAEGGLRWDDPDLRIDWPSRDVQVSEKDAVLPYLRDKTGRDAVEEAFSAATWGNTKETPESWKLVLESGDEDKIFRLFEHLFREDYTGEHTKTLFSRDDIVRYTSRLERPYHYDHLERKRKTWRTVYLGETNRGMQ
jgi:dTDP-4-dehydrorhamnose 3,5-epimerase